VKGLDNQLDAIDRKATKEKVENELENYRLMLLTQELDNSPKITQNFSFVPPTNTNNFIPQPKILLLKVQIMKRNVENLLKGYQWLLID
jgi:ArpU family phage transcriptional regulator